MGYENLHVQKWIIYENIQCCKFFSKILRVILYLNVIDIIIIIYIDGIKIIISIYLYRYITLDEISPAKTCRILK